MSAAERDAFPGLPAAERPLNWRHGSRERAFAHLEQRSQAGQLSLHIFQNTVVAQPRRIFRFFQRLLSFPRGKPDLRATGYNEFEHSCTATDNSSLQLGSHRSDPVTLTGNCTPVFWIRQRQAVSTGKNALVTADSPSPLPLGV